MQNQGRDHEIFETGLEEGVRHIDYPQILHKPAYGQSTSQMPPNKGNNAWGFHRGCTLSS